MKHWLTIALVACREPEAAKDAQASADCASRTYDLPTTRGEVSGVWMRRAVAWWCLAATKACRKTASRSRSFCRRPGPSTDCNNFEELAVDDPTPPRAPVTRRHWTPNADE